MYSFFDLINDLLNGNWQRGEVIGNDIVGEYIIDTCDTSDHGWETAVRKNEGEWVIVGRYENKELAVLGHADWVSVCALNPTKAWSVQLDEYVEF